jgi:hypothetical protein
MMPLEANIVQHLKHTKLSFIKPISMALLRQTIANKNVCLKISPHFPQEFATHGTRFHHFQTNPSWWVVLNPSEIY